MRFFIIDEQRRNNAIDFIKSLDLRSPIDMLINVAKKKRTNIQNNLYWLWCTHISEATGYTEEELHEIFKAEFIGYDVFYYQGIPCLKPKSTTKLTTKGMTAYLERVDFVAKWLGIVLPYPDEIK